MYLKTTSSGTKLKVVVVNIHCTNGKGKSSLYFKNTRHQVKHVDINNDACKKYNIGDSILVYENDDDDWYEIDPATTK